MKLKDKNVLITGASRGLGYALAKVCAKEGANLFLTARTIEGLEKMEDLKFEFPDVKIDCVIVNFIYKEASEYISKLARHFFGTPNILINNAAIQYPIGAFTENDWVKWEDNFTVNFFIPSMLMKEFANDMQSGDKIVNLSGGGATSSRQGFSAYACAKTALVRLTEILAEELRYKGVDVVAIAPGNMSSGMTKEVWKLGPEGVGVNEYQNALNTMEKELSTDNAVELIMAIITGELNGVSGRLISAKWDDWKNLDRDKLDKDTWRLRRTEIEQS